jgi:phospholipase C
MSEAQDRVIDPKITRRGFVAGAGVAAAGAGVAAMGLGAGTASAADSTNPLDGIEHIIVWVQENRSFDHYFGTYPGVAGFADPNAMPGVFTQADSRGPGGQIQPFHLDTAETAADCTADPSHSYGAQHQAWDNGKMDAWGAAHSGDADLTYMGYYTRADMPYYYGMADSFTLCDNYFCSVIGETTPNRLYSMTGFNDPNGLYGGPVQGTVAITSAKPSGSRTTWGVYSDKWITYAEQLYDNNISWKVYGNATGDNEYAVLPLFEQYYPQNYAAGSAMNARATALQAQSTVPQFPTDFLSDVANGTLPQVTWIIPNAVESEHPSFAPQDGENILDKVVTALQASPLWEKTALFFTYDENGGFFDHVAPPVPPAGTANEFPVNQPTVPTGMGFRVPMLIVSPYTRGGFVCHDVFDHTSLIQFMEAKFGIKSPNISDWRRQNAGDLTSAFNFAAPPDLSLPNIPGAVSNAGDQPEECLAEEALGLPYPTPAVIGAPPQESGTRPAPSGLNGALPPPTGGGPTPALPEFEHPVIGGAIGVGLAGTAWLLHRRHKVAADAAAGESGE